MIKAFALVAVVFGTDDIGNAYVIDHGLSAAECIAAMERVEKEGSFFAGDGGDWKHFAMLSAGDTLQCEIVIGD